MTNNPANNTVAVIIAIGSFSTAMLAFLCGYWLSVNASFDELKLGFSVASWSVEINLGIAPMAAGICFAAFGMAIVIVAMSLLLKPRQRHNINQ